MISMRGFFCPEFFSLAPGNLNLYHRYMKTGYRIAIGIIFIILGILGLFLPFLQGILFLVIGIVFLAPEAPPVRRMRMLMYKRFPGSRHYFKKLKKRHQHK